VIFLTSNLGGSQIADLMHGGMGFIQPKDKATTGLHEKVQRTAVEAARRKFSPEFMNRLDKVVVFHPLKRQELDVVLDIELSKYRSACWTRRRAPSCFESQAKAGSSSGRGNRPKVRSRHLKRAIERYLVYPIARLLATVQVRQGDSLVIDHHLGEQGLVFLRDTENRSADRKTDFRLANSGQLMAAEARV